MTTDLDLDRISCALGRFLYDVTDEDTLQRGLAAAFKAMSLNATREVRLSARDRIDFMVGRIGVEVKTAGTLSKVAEQLIRYAESEHVDGLLLVSSRLQLAAQLEPILCFNQKPFRVFRPGTPTGL